MSKIHKLKSDKVPLMEIIEGVRRCDVRWDLDKKFSVGDVLHIVEFDREKREYSGLECAVEVLHILRGYGLHDGMIVMSIGPLLDDKQLEEYRGKFYA